MKKVKSILFRMNLEGKGVVNFDSNDQKYMWNQLKNKERSAHDNVSFAKKNWYLKNGELTYKLKISSDCLRHEIFREDFQFQSPNVANSPELLLAAISSPASILRGYMFAEKDCTIKKRSCFTISDAEQTNDSVSSLETFSRSGKKITDENLADNSFFKKETVGEMQYNCEGFVDLRELQFISLDQIFDRLAINPDHYSIYKSLLETKIPGFNAEPKYYQLKKSEVRIPEFGILFSKEEIVALTKELLMRIFKINIFKSKSFAKIAKLEYKLVYDSTVDTFYDNDGWNVISSEKDINAVDFDPEFYFVEEEKESAEKLREKIVAAEEEKKLKNKEEKAKKKEKNKKTPAVEINDVVKEKNDFNNESDVDVEQATGRINRNTK